MELETLFDFIQIQTLEQKALLLSWQRVVLQLDGHQVLAAHARQLDALDLAVEHVERHHVLLRKQNRLSLAMTSRVRRRFLLTCTLTNLMPVLSTASTVWAPYGQMPR